MTNTPSQDDAWSQLSEADQAGLEWLLENDLDPSGAPPELASRAAKVAGLLALAGDADVAPDPGLSAAVMGRVALADTPRALLSEADEDALDAVMLSGMDSSSVPGALRERADRIVSLAAMLEHASVEHDPLLTDRVMDAIGPGVSAIETERPVLARLGARFADLVSVAAVILIAAAVAWPVMSTVRGNAMRNANQANLAVAGIGLGAYAADFAGQLPRVAKPTQQSQWWQVSPGAATSNASNLFALKTLDYVQEDALRSPGNPDAPRGPLPEDALDWQNIRQVSYSYLLPVEKHNQASAVGVVVADRSPIVLRLLAGQPADTSENSPNHGGRGQHMLRGDGSVIWTTEPYTQYGDHVYLPRPIERAVDSLRRQLDMPLNHMPPPTHRSDVFLGP